MGTCPRCLFDSDFETFLRKDKNSIFGELCDRYHGDAFTTTREAWIKEIEILQNALIPWKEAGGHIVFEYDIPRLGKRIDVVLLLGGVIFCLEFKVGESRILENDVDQVLDYALDLKNFHKFSQNSLIVPILIATNYRNSSTLIQMSIYDDRVVNPLVTGQNGIADILATVYKGNIIKNLIMDCQSYTKYRPNETTGGIFVSWRRKEELPTGA